MLVMWATEALPLAATALVGCLLFWIRTNIPMAKSFFGFTSDTPWYILGILSLGVMADTTGLAKRLAYSIVPRLGTSYLKIFGGMMVLNFVLTLCIALGSCQMPYPLRNLHGDVANRRHGQRKQYRTRPDACHDLSGEFL